MSIFKKIIMSFAVKWVRGKLNKYLTGETMFKSKALWTAVITGVLFMAQQLTPFMSPEVQKIVLTIAGTLETIFIRVGIQKAIDGKAKK